MTIAIETNETELDQEQVASLLEIVANTIRNEEMAELMDGTYQIDTIYGEVWLDYHSEKYSELTKALVDYLYNN